MSENPPNPVPPNSSDPQGAVSQPDHPKAATPPSSPLSIEGPDRGRNANQRPNNQTRGNQPPRGERGTGNRDPRQGPPQQKRPDNETRGNRGPNGRPDHRGSQPPRDRQGGNRPNNRPDGNRPAGDRAAGDRPPGNRPPQRQNHRGHPHPPAPAPDSGPVKPLNLDPVHELIDRCGNHDRRQLSGRLRSIEQLHNAGRPAMHLLEKLIDDTRVAIQRAADRGSLGQHVTFDDSLPISARRQEITEAISKHQVIVVCGETGSGKSTQLPKICLAMGRGTAGLIGHTQPRRIAARSVAGRIAEELGSDLETKGGPVGFKVRFTDSTHPGTLIKVMTDGILLAETQGDRLLEKYDTIIIDEAHERSLNIDFLLGYLVRILPKRPDLKVIITSATIDPERLSNHFGGPEVCPVINVSGRTYPVDIEYRPLKLPGVIRDMSDPDFDEDAMEESLEAAVVHTVADLCARGGGDVLVFLPGEREIRDCQELLTEAGYHKPDRGQDSIEVVPLYARLPAAEQMRVFKLGKGRRIVLATNVAETSVTVPGIKYVIDSGLARISRYTVRSRVQRLPIEKISQASCRQRAGRCGRISAGVCVRLFDEEDYNTRPAFTEPEILRDSLASVILQMLHLHLGDPAQFPFVEPPDSRQIKDGYDTLFELSAVTEDHRLTPVGQHMARLPIDPRLARILLAGAEEGCLSEMLVITAALSVQDPRERPLDQAAAADAKQAIFKDETSDFAGLLKLWQWFSQQSAAMTQSRMRKVCRDHFVSFVRLREWRDVHRQLTELLGPLQSRINNRPAKPDAVGRAILAGLLSSIGSKTDTHEYMGARGNKFQLFPGSGLFKKQPKWVVCSELVRTTKLYARCNAAVSVEWIERVGGHLLKKSHFDPHWDERNERVMCFEKATLFGLEIYTRRRVHFGPQDPGLARDLFIKHGLVEGLMNARGEFARLNGAMLDKARMLQTRLRRSDLLADDTVRYAFFDRHVPADVYTGHDFELWRIKAEKSHPTLLHFSDREVFTDAARGLTEDDFPDTLDLGGVSASLHYVNDPSNPEDGITATFPIEALQEVQEQYGTWLVPGLLTDKIGTLIRSMPRQKRTTFVPTPFWANSAAEEIRRAGLTAAEGWTLEAATAKALTALSEVEVTLRDFDPAEMPQHLVMNYRVTDAGGTSLATGRDMASLRRQLAERVASIIESLAPPEYARDGLTTWDFGYLPETVTLSSRGVTLRAYPALRVHNGRVGLCVRSTAAMARASHRPGLRRLFSLAAKDEMERAIRQMPSLDGLRMLHATIGSAKQLHTSLMVRIAEVCFLADDADVRTREDFERRLRSGVAGAPAAAQQVGAVLASILTLTQATLLQMEKLNTPLHQPVLLDLREQLDLLLEPGFLGSAPWQWVTEYPRYLAAAQSRIRKATGMGGPDRDEQAMLEIRPRHEAYLLAVRDLRQRGMLEVPQSLVTYRWMLEELRVQTFAQELGTKLTVSGKRLDAQWLKAAGEMG